MIEPRRCGIVTCRNFHSNVSRVCNDCQRKVGTITLEKLINAGRARVEGADEHRVMQLVLVNAKLKKHKRVTPGTAPDTQEWSLGAD